MIELRAIDQIFAKEYFLIKDYNTPLTLRGLENEKKLARK
jgi:hypothetical protein